MKVTSVRAHGSRWKSPVPGLRPLVKALSYSQYTLFLFMISLSLFQYPPECGYTISYVNLVRSPRVWQTISGKKTLSRVSRLLRLWVRKKFRFSFCFKLLRGKLQERCCARKSSDWFTDNVKLLTRIKFRKSIENHEVVNRNPSCATCHLHVRKLLLTTLRFMQRNLSVPVY